MVFSSFRRRIYPFYILISAVLHIVSNDRKYYDMARPRVTPWKDFSQLVSVRDQFYLKTADGEDCRAKACSLVRRDMSYAKKNIILFPYTDSRPRSGYGKPEGICHTPLKPPHY